MRNDNIFRHYSRFSIFATKRVSADPLDRTYTIGPADGGVSTVYDGAPEVSWRQLVYFADQPWWWTHGVLHKADVGNTPIGNGIEHITDADAKNKIADYGVYLYAGGSGMTGLLSVSFDYNMVVTQMLMSAVTPEYSNGVIIAYAPTPSVLSRRYEHGAWTDWKSSGSNETFRVVSMEQSDLERLTAAECEEGILYCGLGDVVSSERVWQFGQSLPIVFHR